MRKTALLVAFCLSLMAAAPAWAADFGTAAEAKAMLERAISELKANEATALVKFNKVEAGFKDRDLYVFCFNVADGKMTSHPALVGMDVRTLKEKSGKAFGEDIFNSASEGKITTVDYMFPRPGTTEPVAKESFVTKVGSQGCGVGYYK
jgi:signal transduction histidine kinase